MPTLLYHPAGHISAKLLAAALGLKRARHKLASKVKDSVLIRWGSAAAVGAAPKLEINKRDALRKWGTRHGQLAILQKAGVSVPQFNTHCTISSGPVLTRDYPKGKQPSHGKGITVYDKGAPLGKHNLYMAFIDKARQFRVHIIGDHFRCRELIPTKPENKLKPVWNYDNGFTYMVVQGDRPKGVVPQAKAAVKALGLDFGAVDIIVDKTGKPYVLEVNTAPGLGDETLAWYAEHLAALTSITLPQQTT